MEKAINIQTKESHLKTLYIRNSLQEQSSSSQEEGKMFQQPSFLQNMPKNTIQFMATIHRILQCFLETLRFTVAVFPGLASAARKGQQQTPSRAISAGKLPAPKQGSLQAAAAHSSSFSRSSSSTSLRSMSSSTGSWGRK